ncbi:conserved Plasmodium protein, unknown function [Plasmodium knowlesi strain H]|uniref:Uncharacterized protein n=2 Tax=Plasmodium knowlesi TaxID=5850 RepID=B3L8U4_PLAKH|nr:conserved Plasmodium protein, unknown function [Plasmodium knowlesi strain H]OTN66372.1 Uncharacterized protein PKNOH_S09527200 [Plasmodium knowlesi]CAA9990035.1 conserved Plasmodium protein, unknown function [Plasmodium knowlesi strain H]VVS79509.1 conserved Plasmodium protein, unknown function [Plasmodium knowlesi strain H]|eukprot:XP_002260050.1 hypothetical protein, conserved in Plasmodium species [Plasmodium knowlesi strain H]
MDEHILKKLTSRELKKTILQKAKDILEERERNSNERNKDGKGNATTENEQCYNKSPQGEIGGGSDVDGNVPADKEGNSFYSLYEFSSKYLKMCKMNRLNHENIEYELIISFMRTFNNELKFQLNITSVDDQEDKKNSVLHQMANLFSDKLIYYCTTPMAVVVPHGDNESGLLGDELLEQIRFFFKQFEEKNHENFLFNMCLRKIAECIFSFKPNPEDVASWISRQALADLVKALLGENLRRYGQCIICMTDFIKERHAKLTLAQVDNVVLIIEIVQYAIVYLSERKYNTKCSSFVREEWFKHFTDLLHTLKNSVWKIFLDQLIVTETFLYEKKAENTNKEFNSYYKQHLEVWRLKNTSYSKWFKIEMPLSLSLLK